MYDYGAIIEGNKEAVKMNWKKRYYERYIARAADVMAFNANPTVCLSFSYYPFSHLIITCTIIHETCIFNLIYLIHFHDDKHH